jgi:hypothetical protein
LVINNKNIYFCSTGADRSVAASMPDAREAMLNAAVDSSSAFGYLKASTIKRKFS